MIYLSLLINHTTSCVLKGADPFSLKGLESVLLFSIVNLSVVGQGDPVLFPTTDLRKGGESTVKGEVKGQKSLLKLLSLNAMHSSKEVQQSLRRPTATNGSSALPPLCGMVWNAQGQLLYDTPLECQSVCSSVCRCIECLCADHVCHSPRGLIATYVVVVVGTVLKFDVNRRPLSASWEINQPTASSSTTLDPSKRNP